LLDTNRLALAATARARISARALAAHRHALAMPQAAIAGDIHQLLDIQLNFSPQVALDTILVIHDLADAPNLFLGQIAHPRARVDIRLLEDDHTIRGTDPKNIGDRNLDLLVSRDVY